MRFHLLFAFCVVLIRTDSTTDLNRINSTIVIDLYHCNRRVTVSNVTTTIVTDAVLVNLTDSCGIHCCSNNTISSNLCQLNVHSNAGICLGHLCYSNECQKFMSFATPSNDHPTKNQLHSIFSSLTWSSFLNTTQTKFTAWFDQSDHNIRHTVIIILFIVNIFLILIALSFVIKSIRRANIIAEERTYHYRLL